MFKVGDKVLFTGYRNLDGTLVNGEMLGFLSPVPGDIVELIENPYRNANFPFRVEGLVRDDDDENQTIEDFLMVRLSELAPLALDTPLEDFL